MGFESFISKRYLVSKHKVNFITIISLISIAGITIGVAALIVVLSVFNGFGSLVTSFLVSFEPNIVIGKYTFTGEEGAPTVLIGLRLADKLQTIIGDTITLISPSGIEKAI